MKWSFSRLEVGRFSSMLLPWKLYSPSVRRLVTCKVSHHDVPLLSMRKLCQLFAFSPPRWSWISSSGLATPAFVGHCSSCGRRSEESEKRKAQIGSLATYASQQWTPGTSVILSWHTQFLWLLWPTLAALPYLPLPLQCLQLSLVSFLSQCLVNLRHDRDLLATVSDGSVVFWLWQVTHEAQYCYPHG